MNLLFVPDVADYTNVQFKENTPQQIRSNYQRLESLGIPLGDEVLLLTANPFHKIFLPKGRVFDAGFNLKEYLPLQLVNKLRDGLAEAIESGPIGVEAHYRDCSDALITLGMYINHWHGVWYGHLLALMKGTTLYLDRSIETLKKVESKGLENKDQISEAIQGLVSLKDLFYESLERIRCDFTKRAKKNNTYNVQVFPHSDSELISNSRQAIVENPRAVHSRAELNQMQRVMMYTTRSPSLEEVVSEHPSPSLIMSDLYVFDVFPELEEMFDIHILNQSIDASLLNPN